ncbi:MAG TPA: hypothetical protein VFC96_02965, partial [Anaerovoracaceae bacterium]|nr:hypothetical protein [Anaerovoracaceae bacterium]
MTNIVVIDKHSNDISLLKKNLDQLNLSLGVHIFTNEWDALIHAIGTQDIQGAIINVDLPCCDDFRMIKAFELLSPNLGFIFVSKSGRYKEAWSSYNVVDYFKHPYSKEKLKAGITKLKKNYYSGRNKDIYITTFGSFEIFKDGKIVPWGNFKTKEILAFLVDARGANVSNFKIQKTLWPDSDKKRAANTFHTTMHQVRQILNDFKIDDLIDSSRGSYRANTDIFECDFYEFENEIQTNTKESLTRAFELYQGHYLENNCFDWSSFNRIRL